MELTNAVIASHAAAIRWLDGPDRDPMIARILAYWPPTDRYWPCHGHMDGGHLHIAGGKWEPGLLHGMIVRAYQPVGQWEPSKEILAGLDILEKRWLADYAEHGTRWFDGTPLVQGNAAR